MYLQNYCILLLTTGQNWKKTGSIIFILVLVLLGIVSGAWWLIVSEGKLQAIHEQWVLCIKMQHTYQMKIYLSTGPK